MNVTDSQGPEPSRSPTPASSNADGGVLPPKRIYRDPHGPIGGVAGGFAGYFDIDPVISRLLWIVALFSGIGIPAYFVCWLIIPKAKVWPPLGYGRPAVSSIGQNNTALLSGFVIIGLVAVIGTGVDGVGEYLLPAVLIGFGVYLLGQRGTASAAPEGSPSVAPEGDLPEGEFRTRAAAWPAPDETTPRDRAGLVTPTVLSVLAIGVGVVGALHAAGLIKMSITTAAAGGLVIVGGGLIASLWLGRARGLVPIGLGLASVMLAGATFGPWLADDAPSPRERAMAYLMGNHSASDSTISTGSTVAVGERTFVPESLAELESSYEVGMGDLTVDLSHIDFSGQKRDVEVEVGMGNLTIIVPAHVVVQIDGEVGAGEANTFGRSQDGLGFDVDYEEDDRDADVSGKLDINFQVGMGKAEVRRESL